MTVQEAIKQIEGWKYIFRNSMPKEKAKALNMAIEALRYKSDAEQFWSEQFQDEDSCFNDVKITENDGDKPTNEQVTGKLDLISRQDAQKITAKVLSGYITDDVRNAVEAIDAEIGELPSAQPEQKHGRWIKTESDELCFYRCSTCKRLVDEKTRFCPNCGSYNGGEEDEKD